MDQPKLFQEDRTPKHAPSGRWLETLAGHLDILALSPTLTKVVEAAGEATAAHRSLGQEYGTIYEEALVPLIISTETVQQISDEWVALGLEADHKHFAGVEINDLPGKRSPVDLAITLRYTNRPPVIVPVNVKVEKPGYSGTAHGMALPAFVRHAIDPDFDIFGSKNAHTGFDVDAAIIAWVAERKKLVADRDLYLLLVDSDDDGVIHKHQFMGLLSRVDRVGRPVVVRHASKTSINVRMGPSKALPPDFDVATEIARALLPTGKRVWSAARANLLGAPAPDLDGDAAAGVASRLASLSDAELAVLITQAVQGR